MGEDLQPPPVSDKESLNTKDDLAKAEAETNPERSVEPSMFSSQHKADHVAANPAHSSDDSQYSIAHLSPGSSTKCPGKKYIQSTV